MKLWMPKVKDGYIELTKEWTIVSYAVAHELEKIV